MSGVFINYRTGDADFAVPLVDERLRKEFGDANVFHDARSLEAGRPFPPELLRRLELATVLAVLIGPRWVTLADEEGQPLLRRDEDWVRKEIVIGLERGIAVIPVLLNDVRLPLASELPDDIAELVSQQFLKLRQRHADDDLDVMVRTIARTVPRISGSPPDEDPESGVGAKPPDSPRGPTQDGGRAIAVTGPNSRSSNSTGDRGSAMYVETLIDRRGS